METNRTAAEFSPLDKFSTVNEESVSPPRNSLRVALAGSVWHPDILGVCPERLRPESSGS